MSEDPYDPVGPFAYRDPPPFKDLRIDYTLIICMYEDGESEGNSNLHQLVGAILESNANMRHLVYHVPRERYPDRVDEKYEHATSKDCFKNQVLNAYIYLSWNYRINTRADIMEADQIIILGSSRGARAVLAFAGMSYKIGLWKEVLMQEAENIYAMYMDECSYGKWCSLQIKALCQSSRVSFIGIFDAVGSVGLFPAQAPGEFCNRSVLHVRHAVPLRERRATLQISPFGGKAHSNTTVKEVWFAGTHEDVTGSRKGDTSDVKTRLSSIPLRWMVQELRDVCPNVKFRKDRMPGLGFIDVAVSDNTNNEHYGSDPS